MTTTINITKTNKKKSTSNRDLNLHKEKSALRVHAAIVKVTSLESWQIARVPHKFFSSFTHPHSLPYSPLQHIFNNSVENRKMPILIMLLKEKLGYTVNFYINFSLSIIYSRPYFKLMSKN